MRRPLNSGLTGWQVLACLACIKRGNKQKGFKMNLREAAKIIGYNTSKTPLQNMVKALGMLTYLNTNEDNERREAGKIVLKNWNDYCELCNEKRNKRGL